MLNIDVYSTCAVIRSQEPLTVGLVGGEAHFRFSDRWKGLTKTVVFRQNDVTKDVLPDVTNRVVIPREVLQLPGLPVQIGVCGYNSSGKVVIPTVWVETDPVQEAPDPEEDPTTDPTLPVYAQLQAQMEQDKAVLSQKIDQQAVDMQQHKIEAETTHTQLRQQLEEADKAVYMPALTWDAGQGVYLCNVSIADLNAAYARRKSIVCYLGGRALTYVGANKDEHNVNQYFFRGNSSTGSQTQTVRIYAPEGDEAAKAHGTVHSEPVAADLSSYSMLGRVGVIGDSLSTGVEDGDTTTTEDRNQSWVTWLERATGNPHVHLGYGGATTSGWLRDKLEDALKAENLCDAYILALGFNDCRNWDGNGRAVPLRLNQNGLLDITGSDTWVNAAGETLVYSTYYFNVEKILRKLHEAAPEAPIFVLTNPDYTGDAIANPTAYNQALREIVEVYGEQYNAHLIDLYSLYGSVYQELEQFRGKFNHFPRQIYAYMGQIIGTAITRDIVTSPDAYGTLKGCVGMSHYAMLQEHGTGIDFLMGKAQDHDGDIAFLMDKAQDHDGEIREHDNRLRNLANDFPDVLERVEALERQGISNRFCVNITPTGENTAASDKTFAEITEAKNNNKIVQCKYAQYILPLCWLDDLQAIFGGATSNVTICISIDQNNGVQVQTSTLAIKSQVPIKEEFDRLKNHYDEDVPDLIERVDSIDYSLPETAQVGQVAVVKEVDDNNRVKKWEAVDLPSGGGVSDLSGYVKAPDTAAAGQVLAVKSVDSSGKPSDWVAVRLSNLGEFDALKKSVSAIDNTIGAGTPFVASAEVGQTVVAKAVDENGVPTEWEAADLGSGGVSVGTEWSVVLDTTLTEETSVIRQDVSGFSEYVILLRTVPGSGANKSVVTVDVWTGTSGASAERYSVNDAVWNDGKTKITTQAHFIKPSGATAIYGEITRKGIASNHGAYGFVAATNLITKFDIFTNQSDNAFGVGTQIQIYGR